MKFYADLHIHSKYSRATSRDLTLETLALWGAKKGISLLGTGDFTHPEWLQEIKSKLVPAEEGLFRLRPEIEQSVMHSLPESCRTTTRFMLQVEISSIYKKHGRTRKIHNLFYMPDLRSAEKFHKRLDAIGNVRSDGRPILGLDARDLLEIALECSERAKIIPAHIWTPWFSLFGSKSGFDSVEECFEDLSDQIFALETGLSSDPPMNWRLSMLDQYTLVSNSDNHSAPKLGREGNILNCPLSYDEIFTAIKTRQGFEGTIEFFPEEGKYYLDGHRKCDCCLTPSETLRNKGVCPVCGKPVTVGVLNRVEELADRPEDQSPINAPDVYWRIPLAELLSELLQRGENTKTVKSAYENLLASIGPELYILNDAPLQDLNRSAVPRLAEAIERMRAGQVIRQAGYDGEFGSVKVFG